MPYIGIDFGTSNSVVANFQFGHAEVLPNHEGQKWTPSVVTLRRDGSLAFGQEAKENFEEQRSIRSGVTGRTIRLPNDVSVAAILASRCADRIAGRSIDFFPSGMSCGGAIALTRPGIRFEVRVNWLTGGVDIVPQKLL